MKINKTLWIISKTDIFRCLIVTGLSVLLTFHSGIARAHSSNVLKMYWASVITVLVSHSIPTESFAAIPPVDIRPSSTWSKYYSPSPAIKDPEILPSPLYLSHADIPLNFIWLGSALGYEHELNLNHWLSKGVPVVLWYIPRVLSQYGIREIKRLPSLYRGLLVLDLTKAGLDDLYVSSLSVSDELVNLTERAMKSRKFKHLFATASNLARLALMVKGQEAILTAAAADGEPLPEYNHPGMIYMDTDIYMQDVYAYHLPKADVGVHVYSMASKGYAQKKTELQRYNNDVLYAAHANTDFFSFLLLNSLNKIQQAKVEGTMDAYLKAYPPLFNGALFVQQHFEQWYALPPSIKLFLDKGIYEGNWRVKSSDI